MKTPRDLSGLELAKALRKMRHPTRLRHLQGFLESEQTIFQ